MAAEGQEIERSMLAEIREQCPEPLRDYCDIQLTMAPVPVRSVGRIGASG